MIRSVFVERISIAIDMDEVLADTSKKVFQTAKELGLPVSKEELRGKSIWTTLTKEQLIVLGQAINTAGYFRDLEVIDSAIPVVKELSEHYDIYIATAAMEVPFSFMDKYEWLKEHFPFLDHNYFIFCGNKKVVHADYLIDDTVSQLDNFTGTGILFEAYHNENMKTDHVHVSGWNDVREYFKKVREQSETKI